MTQHPTKDVHRLPASRPLARIKSWTITQPVVGWYVARLSSPLAVIDLLEQDWINSWQNKNILRRSQQIRESCGIQPINEWVERIIIIRRRRREWEEHVTRIDAEILVKISMDNLFPGIRSPRRPKRRFCNLRGDCKPYPHNVKLVNF